jgi:hypothetical protein
LILKADGSSVTTMRRTIPRWLPIRTTCIAALSHRNMNETSARNQIANAQEFVRRTVQILAQSGEIREDDRAVG